MGTRLTTLSILALAVIALLDKWSKNGIDTNDNTIRKEKLTERYIGNYSLSKLTISPKITLNRNNDDYYKSWLLNYRTPSTIAKLKPSQRLLQKAFNYYYDQVQARFNENKSGAEVSDFLEKNVGNGIVFTQIIVSNDLDAFKVFETPLGSYPPCKNSCLFYWGFKEPTRWHPQPRFTPNEYNRLFKHHVNHTPHNISWILWKRLALIIPHLPILMMNFGTKKKQSI
ncbi:MAG: hypothetical protein IPM69_01525 [Ignavibacteria bacterium]|nr:hypothetical protein [Ignavibacteria bacterium]